MRQRDRKSELVEIAYRLIAQNGLEGFRIRQVAAEAGIDNGTAINTDFRVVRSTKSCRNWLRKRELDNG